MVMESTNGLMEGSLMGSGEVIRSMDMVSLPGLMAENMKDIMSTIKKMVKVHSPGQMVDSILEDGRMEINMA